MLEEVAYHGEWRYINLLLETLNKSEVPWQ